MVTPEREALRRALQARLRIVEGRLERPSPETFQRASALDAEEALRVLMVRLWPLVSRRTASQDEQRQFFAMLGQLWEPALSDDLRFLDAWNNAYETAAETFPPGLIAAYRQLLDAHVRRLVR